MQKQVVEMIELLTRTMEIRHTSYHIIKELNNKGGYD